MNCFNQKVVLKSRECGENPVNKYFQPGKTCVTTIINQQKHAYLAPTSQGANAFSDKFFQCPAHFAEA